MIAGMLMFISFPAIVSERLELSSLASSLKNDVLSDRMSKSIAKPVVKNEAECSTNWKVYATKRDIIY